MLINQANLTATQIGFRTIFAQALEAFSVPEIEQLAMSVPSTSAKEQYKWVGALPVMKEWLSDAAFEKLNALSWEIVNKTWQAGLEVDREDLEDDNLRLLTPASQTLAQEAKRHPLALLADLLNNGFTAKGYDGQYFFDTDHKDADETAQANAITTALSATSYGTLRAAMRNIKDYKGRPLNIMPTHLVTGPALEATAKKIVSQELTGNGESNVNFGTAKLITTPYITSATAWFLLDLSRAIKPLVLQTRRSPEFAAQDQPDDEQAFMRKKYRYSVTARYNAGYGLWQLAAGSTGAS